MKAEKEGFYL